MAALKTRTIDNADMLDIFLRGGVVAGDIKKYPVYGLHGKTLVFTSPSATTVTFADATGAGLTLKDIVSQINAGIANVTARLVNGRLCIVHTTAASAIAITAATSTAGPLIGLSSSVNVAGTLYAAPSGVAPRLIDFKPSGRLDGLIVITEE